MLNTLIFVFTLLESSKVFSQEIPLSINQTRATKRFSNTASSNTTFWIDLTDQSYLYYAIELILLQPAYVDLALIQFYGQPPFFQGDELVYSDMDYDSYIQHSRKHFIQVDKSLGKVFYTVLTNVSVSFDIIVTASNTPMCKSNCNGNGTCIDGECQCNNQHIGRDCGQYAIELDKNSMLGIGTTQEGIFQQYFFYEQDGTQSLSLEITTTSFEQVEAFLLVPNEVYLPTEDIYNQAATITKDQPFKILIDQNKRDDDDDDDEQRNGEIHDRLILLIKGGDFEINLNTVSKDNKGQQIKLIIIIVCSIVGALLLCIIAVLIRRAKQRRDREKQSPEVGEKQLAYPPQFKKEELDEFIQIVGQDSIKDNQDNCAICLDPLNNNFSLRTTPCKHVFHSACIEKWLTKNHFCPFCRYDLNVESLKQSTKLLIKVPATNVIRIQQRND